ncbi:hypothetical protein CERSUDRAFT_94981 [Gelatoporia subvermispora B]|uniref:Uncharacterized protein n=1 Tax=Ceriporiopsis subvermispora (strain B) TaxID=914234 RepID=M2RD17_CERS8|nr:hypothetical protein CERSUDRAFT_94981 [Gelatoporia subvermispora B]
MPQPVPERDRVSNADQVEPGVNVEPEVPTPNDQTVLKSGASEYQELRAGRSPTISFPADTNTDTLLEIIRHLTRANITLQQRLRRSESRRMQLERDVVILHMLTFVWKEYAMDIEAYLDDRDAQIDMWQDWAKTAGRGVVTLDV